MHAAWHGCDNKAHKSGTPHLLQYVAFIAYYQRAMYSSTASSTEQSLNKDRLQLRTAWVHVAGFKGNRDQMQAQLEHLREQFPLPFTADALYQLEDAAQADDGALTTPASKPHLLSTYSKRSILFALEYECVFAINTDIAVMHNQHAEAVYPLRMVSSLPAPEGHKGHMPTLIVQPWLISNDAEPVLVSRFFGFSAIHRLCLDDIYATWFLCLQSAFTTHGIAAMEFVQLLWHTPAVTIPQASGKQSKTDAKSRNVHPPTLYLYVVPTELLSLHTMIVRETFSQQEQLHHQFVDMYQCMQLHTPTVPLTHAHVQRRSPADVPWLLLVAAHRTPLHYVHQLLIALGISPHAIFGLAYTTNGGQYADNLLAPTNILVHLSSQHVLDQLAERWYRDKATDCINIGTIVTVQRSPRVTKLAPGKSVPPLLLQHPMPTLEHYAANAAEPLTQLHEIVHVRLPPAARNPPRTNVSNHPPTPQPPVRQPSPKRSRPNDRHGTLPTDAMELEPPLASDSDSTDSTTGAPPDRGVLQTRLEESAQALIDYDEDLGINILTAITQRYMQQRTTRAAASPTPQQALPPTALALIGTGTLPHLSPSAQQRLYVNALTAPAPLRQQHHPECSFPVIEADWHATPGDGLCGYYAVAACLSAQAASSQHNLLLFLTATLAHPQISGTLSAKITLTIAHIRRGTSGMLPRDCWCSIGDVQEIAALCTLSLTIWIGQHYTSDAPASAPPLLHPYRICLPHQRVAHVALYAGHFYCMHETPPLPHSLLAHPSDALDGHLGCGVLQPPALLLRTAHDVTSSATFSDLQGGTKRTRSAAQLRASSPPTASSPTITVPQHTIDIAKQQNWCGLGTLIRALQHDTPPRPIRIETSTKQQCRATALFLLTHLPTSDANSALRLALARLRNDSHSSASLKFPTMPPIPPVQLLQAANDIDLPIIIWSAPDVSPPPTHHHCHLLASSTTVHHSDWHRVQHVLLLDELLLCIAEPPQLTTALIAHLQHLHLLNEASTARPFTLAVTSHPPHSVAAQHHFNQRDPTATQHCITPGLPHMMQRPASTSTRTSLRHRPNSTLHRSPLHSLRTLPLPLDLIQHPQFLNCDPELILHYWHNRGSNQYVHVRYDGHVAGKGGAGLFASTPIDAGTRIAPYVGNLSPRRPSRTYTLQTTDGSVDAAECPHDYGYLMFAPASPAAPHNVARYANSLRHDQLATRTFNAIMAVSPLSSTFSTMWLTAITFIAPGDEILCDYGDNYTLPTSSPPIATPLTQSSTDAADFIQLSYTSTGTLVDSASTRARTRQRSQRHPSPPQRLHSSTQSSTGTELSVVDLTDIWDDAELPSTPASQHEIHLHPAGHGYSSDDSGDGPTTVSPAAHLLNLDISALRLATQHDAAVPRFRCATADIIVDLAAPALRTLASAATARNATLTTTEIEQLLTAEPPLVLSQRDDTRCFSNTQGRGYCGYIVLLQLYLQHHHSWLAYPNLENMDWRNALATLLDHLLHLHADVPHLLQSECETLRLKTAYISQRLRRRR